MHTVVGRGHTLSPLYIAREVFPLFGVPTIGGSTVATSLDVELEHI